jgi:hypothetical protein
MTFCFAPFYFLIFWLDYTIPAQLKYIHKLRPEIYKIFESLEPVTDPLIHNPLAGTST